MALVVLAVAYLSVGSASARRWWGQFQGWRWSLVTAGLLGALTLPLAPSLFAWAGGVSIAALVANWFRLFGASRAAELWLVALYGALALAKVAGRLYPEKIAKLPTAILWDAGWTWLFLLTVLLFRRPEVPRFGLWPNRREWATALVYFVAAMPLLGLLCWATGFAGVREGLTWSKALLGFAGTFLGIFVFVALREEFLFRGLLQPVALAWTGRLWPALLLTNVLFGLVHLPLRPHWNAVVVTGVAGLIYGLCYSRTRSLQTTMLLHALVATTWRVLLR